MFEIVTHFIPDINIDHELLVVGRRERRSDPVAGDLVEAHAVMVVATTVGEAIDNTGGFWIHLTANGGDEMLTTGLEGVFPSGTTSINLYAGWNLVGYPSATSRLASDALAGTSADMIAYHNPVAPYRIDETSDLSSIMMDHGNAYWVRVPADTVWNIDP